ncbi:hypothetical protein [Gordonia sp. (in: high G+C Gram-positive bacteria)]|nr:hypothetical protein [Gordonia sp. (in: high G+C Gram-positive bacteria)]
MVLHERPQVLGGLAWTLVETFVRCRDRPVAKAHKESLYSW